MYCPRKYANEQSAEDQGRYEFAEQEAKSKRAGLWQDKNPQPPWEFRAVQRVKESEAGYATTHGL